MVYAWVLVAALLGSDSATFVSTVGICPEARSTPEIEECLTAELKKSETQLELYYNESLKLLAHSDQARVALIESQKAWQVSRDAFARAAYDQYSPGTMAGMALLGWKLTLTDRRAHDLWQEFVRTKVSELPEPKSR